MKRFVFIAFNDEVTDGKGLPISYNEIKEMINIGILKIDAEKIKEKIRSLEEQGYEYFDKEDLKNVLILHIEE